MRTEGGLQDMIEEGQHASLFEVQEGVYKIVFHNSSRAAVTELYARIETVIHQTTSDHMILILLDASDLKRLPSIPEIFRKAREFEKRFPDAPPSRFAIMVNPGVLMSLVQSFVNSLSSYQSAYNRARFFKQEQYDEAVEWLVAEQANYFVE